MKQNLAVFFGGKSVEHDVSIVTGLQAAENADTEKFNIIPVYLARNGRWYTGSSLLDISAYVNFDPNQKEIFEARLSTVPGEGLVLNMGLFKRNRSIKIDVALLCMHGAHGEDGTLQGLLELADVPYTSPGVAGSAAGMDKAVMKRVFKGCGFPIVDFVELYRTQWKTDKYECIRKIESSLRYPVYIKPANLGSSIGISKVSEASGLFDALNIAFAYDRKIIAENGVADPVEINCSVLGIDDNVTASLCEKPLGWKEFLSFDDKYMQGGKGSKSKTREIPAPISDELTERIQTLAKEAFKALDCKGVVRIDFLLDNATGELYINEINTIPGSLSYYLWEPSGLSYKQLIDRLAEIAQKAAEQKKLNEFSYSSELINKIKSGGIQKSQLHNSTAA